MISPTLHCCLENTRTSSGVQGMCRTPRLVEAESDWSDPEQVQESAVAEGTPRSAFSSLGVSAGRRGACPENSHLTARAGLCAASRRDRPSAAVFIDCRRRGSVHRHLSIKRSHQAQIPSRDVGNAIRTIVLTNPHASSQKETGRGFRPVFSTRFSSLQGVNAHHSSFITLRHLIP